MSHLAFPFAFDARGCTNEAGSFAAHVGDLVEQTLLVAPGERVNRPDFGAGLIDMVFEPGSDTLSDAADFLVRSSLQRWLQDVVLIEDLSVRQDDSQLIVDLTYMVLDTNVRQSQTVTRLL